jgi:cell division protein FtsW
MGESTFVNRAATRLPRPAAAVSKSVGRTHAGIDWILVGIVIGLTLFGLLMVFSAGPKFAREIQKPTDYFLKRQLIWAIGSLIMMVILSRIPYRWYARLTVPMMVVMIAMLLIVAALKDTTLGANRSFLSGSIRPSELAKLVIIIYVSVWLTAKREVLNDITLGLLPLMLILGITGGLILIQPDLSAAITVVILGGILFFLAGGAWRQIALTLVAASLLGWLIVNVYPTGMERVKYYLAGLHDLSNASYHVQRSLEAIINGGIFGVGIGHSSTKFTGLPVAPTDSIFAVIAEETGLVGSALIILAYLVLLWRGIEIARRSKDLLGSLLACGISIWIVVEALLNIAVMVNLLPHAGNALPLISYGGSSLLVTLSAVGILLNISSTSEETNSTQSGGTFGSVVDMRWRDRRGRVSRFGHPPSTRK